MNTSPSYYRSLFQLLLTTSLAFVSGWAVCSAQTGRASHSAIVVDERLAALRSAPELSAPLLRRLSRGRKVFVLDSRRSPGGVLFHRVAITRRTRGWIQREALILPRRSFEDGRLFRLIEASVGFDRLGRARIFLDAFPHSRLRPTVLLMLGDEATKTAAKLSHDAARRLDAAEMSATGASLSSYFLNYSGLDRLNRLGVSYVFDSAAKRFHYDGAAWREILRRYPHSPEATKARQQLYSLHGEGTSVKR